MSSKTRLSQFEAFISSIDDNRRGLLVLDAGAGEQRNRQYITNNTYISQDFGEYKGGGSVEYFDSFGRNQWNSQSCDIISDIVNIPLDSNTIDIVLCTEVFEHLPSPERGFAELLRILKPGALLILTVPNLCHAHQQPYFFYSGFSLNLFETWSSLYSGKVIQAFEEGSLIEHLLFETWLLPRYQSTFLKRVLILFFSYPACILLKICRSILHRTSFSMPSTNTGLFLVIRKDT